MAGSGFTQSFSGHRSAYLSAPVSGRLGLFGDSRACSQPCSFTRSSTSTRAPTTPRGDAIETFIRGEDAERFIWEVRGDDPQLASYLRIEVQKPEAGAV